jgi:Fe-S-cluster containining protein
VFPCSSCGICCQNISLVKELKDFDLGDGSCKHYNTIDLKCNIYETRPNICRVEKMFDIEYFKYFSKNEFYILNAKVCNELQNKYEMDKKYKITIGE